MPALQSGGFLGMLFSGFTWIGKWLSDNIMYGGLNLWGTFVGFLDTIAAWIGFPNGFSLLLIWLGSGITWLTTSFTYLISLILSVFIFLGAIMTDFLSLISQAVTNFANMISVIRNLMDGTITGGVNLWNELNIPMWITIALICYPIYLVIVWDEEGFDKVQNHLMFVFNILNWMVHLFIGLIQTVLAIISTLVESVPVAE
jgi:hypothetical protein